MSSGFCMPDLFLGVSGRLDSNCRWGASAMPMAKFTMLLKSVLSAAAMVHRRSLLWLPPILCGDFCLQWQKL